MTQEEPNIKEIIQHLSNIRGHGANEALSEDEFWAVVFALKHIKKLIKERDEARMLYCHAVAEDRTYGREENDTPEKVAEEMNWEYVEVY